MAELSLRRWRILRHEDVAEALDRVPMAREAASPFVAGETIGSAVTAVLQAMASGMGASVLHLPDPRALAASRLVDLQVISALVAEDVAAGTDLTVDLAALGLGRTSAQALRTDLSAVCAAAAGAAMTVTLAGLGEHVADALALHGDLAAQFPDVGITLAAALMRTESDCVDMAASGVRVRLVKREGPHHGADGFSDPHDVDKSFVRCVRVLMDGGARTVVATHDPRLVEISAALAERADRGPGEVAYQFRRGLVPPLAAELVASGANVGLLVPFGPGWAEYVSAHVSPTPATVGRAVRAAVSSGAGR